MNKEVVKQEVERYKKVMDAYIKHKYDKLEIECQTQLRKNKIYVSYHNRDVYQDLLDKVKKTITEVAQSAYTKYIKAMIASQQGDDTLDQKIIEQELKNELSQIDTLIKLSSAKIQKTLA